MTLPTNEAMYVEVDTIEKGEIRVRMAQRRVMQWRRRFGEGKAKGRFMLDILE